MYAPTNRSTVPPRGVLGWTAGLALLALIIGLLTLGSCSEPQPAIKAAVVVDQTGIITGSNSTFWKGEGAGAAGTIFDQAVASRIDEIELITLGSSTADAAKVATVSLHVDGNTAAKRDTARAQLRDDFVAAITQILNTPVKSQGSDVTSAFQAAIDACSTASTPCAHVWLLSDMEDTRLLHASSAEAAINRLQPLLPKMQGSAVTAVGVGASGSAEESVTRVREAWPVLLHTAGAGDVRLLRSI